MYSYAVWDSEAAWSAGVNSIINSMSLLKNFIISCFKFLEFPGPAISAILLIQKMEDFFVKNYISHPYKAAR